MGPIYKFQKRFNIKPRVVKIAEAIIDLLPPEEWERMNTPGDPLDIGDIRDLILLSTKGATCHYSKKKALRLAKYSLEIAKLLPHWEARLKVIKLFARDLFTYWYRQW